VSRLEVPSPLTLKRSLGGVFLLSKRRVLKTFLQEIVKAFLNSSESTAKITAGLKTAASNAADSPVEP
jgi:hypothetical protein